MVVRNNTFDNNRTELGRGGAILVEGIETKIIDNNTMVNNRAGNSGGAVAASSVHDLSTRQPPRPQTELTLKDNNMLNNFVKGLPFKEFRGAYPSD